MHFLGDIVVMKKLLLVLLLSVGFIGSTYANSIEGAFGYKLGQVVKDAEIYGGHDPFSWFVSQTDFIPKKPLPMLQTYRFDTTVISKKIFEIRGSINTRDKPFKYHNCHFAAPSTDFGKLLRILEAKYGDFELIDIEDDRWEPLIKHRETYQFNDGNRRIYLSCTDIQGGLYSMLLIYEDLKLSKQADKEEQKMIMDSNPDYDL